MSERVIWLAEPAGPGASVRSVTSPTFCSVEQCADEVVLRREYERLRELHALAERLTLAPDAEVLWWQIADEVARGLGSDRVVVLGMDAETEELGVVAFAGPGCEAAQLSRSLVEEVAATGRKALLCAAVRTGDGIRGALCAPLWHAGRLEGVVHVHSSTATIELGEWELRWLADTAVVAAAAVAVRRRLARIEAAARRRTLLRHSVAPALVEGIMTGQVEARLEGARREVTMLFVDIRTSLYERIPMVRHAPMEMVESLNAHFEVLVEVLFRHGGTLDKYVGDEMIAVFGAPIDQADAPLRAVRCAMEMVRAVAEHGRERVDRGEPAIHVGIGVHTGAVLAGIVGAGGTRRFSVQGEAVNVAARLCGMTQPGEILISESTYVRVLREVRVVLVVLHRPEGGPGGKLGPIYRVQRLRG